MSDQRREACLRAELGKMKASLEFLRKAHPFANRRLKVTLREKKQLNKRKRSLSEYGFIQEYNRFFFFIVEGDLVECQASLLKPEQCMRLRNLEMKGIEERGKENLQHVLEKILQV